MVAVLGGGIYGVAISVVVMRFGVVAARVILARRVIDVSIRYWITRILIPLSALIAVVSVVGLVIGWLLPPSFVRVLITTGCVELTLLPLTWFFMFDDSERIFFKEKVLSRIPVLGRRMK